MKQLFNGNLRGSYVSGASPDMKEQISEKKQLGGKKGFNTFVTTSSLGCPFSLCALLVYMLRCHARY